ncbi:zinc-binding loop region of homing endonuclease-domain-containing protein [Lipomyces chichibuensis]|uniref:zinc-binding loop region of homing endonuclease-domain-containing protein n=1 Tax=Lipomyces chichibuensis TaxID=1546026 RepID=UPI003343C951
MRKCILPTLHLQDTMEASEEQLSSQSTTASDRDRREQFIDGLAAVNCDANALDRITPVMALKLINSYRHITTNIGCWQARLRGDKDGHIRITVKRIFGEHHPFLHQIALIATDRRGQLTATLGSRRYDVSHLCHNARCFNPEHLIVESSRHNQERRTCNGHKIIVHEGLIYHPCSHGRVEAMHKCILPVVHLQDGYHVNHSE